MMKVINFPIIQFIDKDKYIASVETQFCGDKKMIKTQSKFSQNFEIVDCQGQLFLIKNLLPNKFSII